jgi:hypothetical protein
MTTEVLGSTTAKPEPPASWIPTDSTFGARLALIRQRMGWGNVKLAAEACGVPPESWRTWERDGVEPRGLNRIAKKISERTGCDYGWLVGGPELAGRQPASTTPRYVKVAERAAARRPIDNRPASNKPTGPPSPRRTSRVPRAARS